MPAIKQQKNQQEPTHFLPTQRKNTTFAKQRNKKNTTEKAENPKESRLKQINQYSNENKNFNYCTTCYRINVVRGKWRYQSNTVNVTQQQKPAMLVIPSDQLLQQFGKLKQQEALGKTLQVRDYNGYLLTDQDSKFIISTIQSAFIQMGYPLNDLEQTLKSINEQEMLDAIDGIQKDAKTILLTTAKPDIILELDYNIVTDRSSRDFKKSLTYTLRAIDAFSNKVVATIQQTNFEGNSKTATPATLMESALAKDTKGFTQQINNHFNTIIETGREITLRVTIDNGVNLTMSDECLDGDTYSDFIIDWVKVNTLLGAYNMNRNTETEMYFTNVKIKTLNDNGTQYSAYDFARELSKALNKGCGIKSRNTTQGLGMATISIKGM